VAVARSRQLILFAAAGGIIQGKTKAAPSIVLGTLGNREKEQRSWQRPRQ
jgi:hypothetical protein